MDYQTSFLTSNDRRNSFDAITKGIDKWWGKVDNSVGKLGDEFSIFFGNTEWRFKITQYLPYEKVKWKCIKANHVHDGLQNIQEEWLHTEVEWDIKQAEEKTKITITHNGLNNQLNCYEVCKSGWDYFLLSSLKDYLEMGKGTPHSE
ncbi:SRPBCC family protein [Muriicola sp. Z0-33]|uniref:SRPBCC family protein n=1 Tax=Muriicola sp. Z0-33 TaxID=2816957 RepID=UPI00223716B9|nr:SRPBCC domain-containing protein [Muriicola sp. Z0-33]MCW5518144.1 SRPBCC domain-containing protein [Muriicola sp. Z0-33]